MSSEQDRRRASELKRKADEIGQPALAKVLGVGVRTLQRYIKLERAMRAQEVDRFEAQFGRTRSLSVATPSQPQHANGEGEADDPLERVITRHEVQLSYAVVKRVRDLRATGLALSEQQWEQLVSAILTGRQPSP